MRSIRILQYGIILLASSFALWGCPKSAEVSNVPEAQQGGGASASAATAAQPEGSQTGAAAGTAQEKQEGPAEKAASSAAGLRPVYFDFDRSFIREEARKVMADNAAWLKANPKAKIRIEGNADERGTREYNQALGQRRAVSAKKFLTDAGIAGARMSLISYGKEKQVCSESTEECWQKNRRDEFAVVSD